MKYILISQKRYLKRIFYRKWRLNYDEFVEMIESLCKKKGLDKELVMTKLLAAGIPPVGDIGVIIK